MDLHRGLGNAQVTRHFLSARIQQPQATLRHGITFRALRVAVVAARWTGGDGVAEAGEAGWFSAERAAALALTGVTRKTLARLASVAG